MLTNPHDMFRGLSRSSNIVPFHMLDIVFCAIVTLSSRCAIFLIFYLKNVMTLKSVSEVTQGVPFYRLRRISYYRVAQLK